MFFDCIKEIDDVKLWEENDLENSFNENFHLNIDWNFIRNLKDEEMIEIFYV